MTDCGFPTSSYSLVEALGRQRDTDNLRAALTAIHRLALLTTQPSPRYSTIGWIAMEALAGRPFEHPRGAPRPASIDRLTEALIYRIDGDARKTEQCIAALVSGHVAKLEVTRGKE